MHPNDTRPAAISRRNWLGQATALTGGAALLGQARLAAAPASGRKPKVAIFSKHLLFLRGDDLAKGAATISFDGIDLAVRKGGHVEPERVTQDLPTLVAIIRKHGLEVPMLTTDIVDADSPYAEDILKAMTSLGIHHYRWGGMKWTDKPSYAEQLEAWKPRVARLAALNSRYKATAMYHTHSGIGLIGASIWDLHIMLKDFDPAAVGINYDIGHATIEGGFGGWIDSFKICGPHLRGIAVKDFLWAKKNGTGAWTATWKPLGEGMCHLPQFFSMVAATDFAGPLQLHFEYPLGGADSGKSKLTSTQEEVFAVMKKDLTTLRGYLDQAYA